MDPPHGSIVVLHIGVQAGRVPAMPDYDRRNVLVAFARSAFDQDQRPRSYAEALRGLVGEPVLRDAHAAPPFTRSALRCAR